MDKLNIVIIEGTKRVDRKSILAAQYIYKIAQTYDELDVVFVDPLEINLSPEGSGDKDRDPKYSEITKNADGFFIVTPEYNHSYPSSLKRLIDSEYENYKKKPVALAGVSNGPWGGVRCIESLSPVVKAVGLVSLQKDVQFPFIQNVFDENGNPKDPEVEKRVRTLMQELIWMAKALKYGRENFNI